MRLFVGVFPPPAARDDLARAVAGLHVATAAVNTRLVPPERRHVTLAFLGEVDEHRLPAAADALTGVAVEPPELRIAGGGRFGRGRFTLLWAGVDGDLDPLAGAVRAALRRARLPFDRKPFRPHLTLARPGDRLTREQVDADRDALGRYAGPPWTAGEIALVESRNGPHPGYEVRAVGRLSG
ncbi:RNA 2',3'-cyclic phosphodiesterase [Spirilliplanes yamanashiensis]|uniref:RNA 2',3'-cyclic phosphodiesterase n=1 Tax=Spirilliplanes yamanashiensis TaxID=42233 RepID=A0A8J4DK07_9ACTN|nr:RNA 2',3'-cyclic phosphodiesterase [Spirilliplanes yamanashiensis]MDP9815539.1 2'-5' RNA ligase [Spirilliplanes yamanashiensis]GIJ03793.1 RNA 2',3'-cyclic phosphodiesterase [Spirilliplanes yamanashiensis]